MPVLIPLVIAVAGKKREGKDYFCDSLAVSVGYKKIHIADCWLDVELADMGTSREEYALAKGKYRAEIQRRAEAARAANPRVLIDPLLAFLEQNPDLPVCITGVRFLNEVEALRKEGAIIVRVRISEHLRRVRFTLSGEDMELFDDPFEREIDQITPDLTVWGDISPATQLQQLIDYSAQAFVVEPAPVSEGGTDAG